MIEYFYNKFIEVYVESRCKGNSVKLKIPIGLIIKRIMSHQQKMPDLLCVAVRLLAIVFFIKLIFLKYFISSY